MAEIDFLNNKPEQGGTAPQQPVPTDRKREDTPFAKEEIRSKEYTDIKPLCASRYGNSRLFTAQYNGHKVVIKTLKKDRASNPKCRASLRHEYDTTASLDSKYIRKAIDFTSIEGLGDCIIFEFVEGKTLAEHVRVGTLSEKQVKYILVEICDGLAYLHRNQTVHCNLKPENIMVTPDECHVRLIDLGVPETDPDADRELLIKEMEFVAPEIIKGEEPDPRSDIYSLGKIMEFFGERNISRLYTNTATHCTQFSKEQRYESISEVRSAITKGRSLVKTLLLLMAVIALCAVAFVYVPKIKANVEKERAERMSADFSREMDNMKKELPELYKKYALSSIDEPVAFDWSDDSLRFVQKLTPFFATEEYKAQALNALNAQRNSIKRNRQKEFDQLLLDEFKQAGDSLAVQMKSALVEPTDSVLLVEAVKWYRRR